MFDPRPLYYSSLTTAVGGTKDTNFVDSESPYRGMNQAAGIRGCSREKRVLPRLGPIIRKTKEKAELLP